MPILNVLKWLVKSGTGRAILAGLVCVGLVYAAKVYFVELPAFEAIQEKKSGEAKIETLADAFAEHVTEMGQGAKDALPKRSNWYPETLPCAAKIEFGVANDPIWTALKIDPKEETAFQYRFDRKDNDFTFWARRDADCDGLFSVYRIEASTDWKTIRGRKVIRENRNE